MFPFVFYAFLNCVFGCAGGNVIFELAKMVFFRIQLEIEIVSEREAEREKERTKWQSEMGKVYLLSLCEFLIEWENLGHAFSMFAFLISRDSSGGEAGTSRRDTAQILNNNLPMVLSLRQWLQMHHISTTFLLFFFRFGNFLPSIFLSFFYILFLHFLCSFCLSVFQQ